MERRKGRREEKAVVEAEIREGEEEVEMVWKVDIEDVEG